MISNIRLLALGSALFVATNIAFAASGEYQQTRDGKTTGWNGNPKPGESASWVGARDKDGYATGFGTVTWYTADGSVYAMYYGNMVNGKFEGPVNAHVGRQRAHAYFVNGSRETAWARGPAPSKMNVPEELIAKRRKAEAEQPKPRDERAQAKKEKTEKRAETAETLRPIEHAPKPESTQTPAAETAAPPREQTPTPAPIAESTIAPTPEPTQSTSTLFEPPTIAETHETPRVRTPEPSIEQKPTEPPSTPVESQPTAAPERKSGGDASLNALTGPPSSLRNSSLSESGPEPKSEAQSRSTSTGSRGVAQLSEDEAISLADVEARGRGYDLGNYQRPKADYSAVKDKWTLFYNLKDPKMAGGDTQPFSVTVEDKTKKVEIRRNY